MNKQSVAWRKLFETYDIVNRINTDGEFYITARQIKQGTEEEARTMAKFDCTSALPEPFRENNISILPVRNGTYVLSDFILYEPVPEMGEVVRQMPKPYYETVNERSESNVINQLILSKILDDFLDADNLQETFHGRQRTGEFDFTVDTYSGEKRTVHVDGVQLEIDGGFEDNNIIAIMEAKNVLNDDFIVRQLYYPYRMWQNEVTKQIRLIFAVYSNEIYALHEYKFTDPDDYSSIELVRSGFYTLVDDLLISFDELDSIRRTSEPETQNIPFPQCDRFDRIINLLDILNERGAMTADDIADAMEFTKRQADYYFNGGAYLGLFTKDENKRRKLTRMGELIAKMAYKPKQLALVRQILRHDMFKDLYDEMRENEAIPPLQRIMELMSGYCTDFDAPMLRRRGQTVMAWLRWIERLTLITTE